MAMHLSADQGDQEDPMSPVLMLLLGLGEEGHIRGEKDLVPTQEEVGQLWDSP